MVTMVEGSNPTSSSSTPHPFKSRTELQTLKADGELIIDSARTEHAKIMLEANQLKDVVVNEARMKALEEANKIIDNARLQIEAEKNNAIRDIRNQIATLSVDVAEKVIRTKLDRKEDHSTMINRLLDEMKISKS